MKSRWHHLKETAVAQRRAGVSMTVIERELGIARSTLSYWFRKITLTNEQRARLLENSHISLANGRIKSVAWHNQQKAARLAKANEEATTAMSRLNYTNSAILDLAFAMLYWGEGTKKDVTSIGSSDPKILRFTLAVLRINYSVTAEMVRCDLHLRVDQDGTAMKAYWSEQLRVPLSQFKHVTYDKRTRGRPTYPHYKGVCMLYCGSVAIQRKLISLYNLFCDKVLDMGA